MKRRTVCDIREVASVKVLRKLANVHAARVDYVGSDLGAHPVYVVRLGVIEYVARGAGRDPHPMPLEWRSPLERTSR